MGFGDGRAGDLAVHNIDAAEQFRLGGDGFGKAAGGDEVHLRECDVGERLGGGAGISAGSQQHAMAALGELIHGERQQTDTVLFGFYFTRNANNHERKLTAKRCVSNAQYVLSRFFRIG